MQIVIPTYMRETRQRAFNLMPKEIQKRTIVVTHSGRAELLKANNPCQKVHDLGQTDGIADVRQKIFNWLSKSNDKIFIIDDHCQFYTSESDGEKRKISPTPFKGNAGLTDWRRMLEDVESQLDEHGQVGISPRPGNNRHLGEIVTPGRVYSCYGLNVKRLKTIGCSFDGMYKKDNRIKLFEDFYLSLHMLTRGVSNAVLYNYGFMHSHGEEGGNSTIRTNDLQKLCLEKLQEEFPRYVKIVQRKAISWSIGNPDFRWECVISWKKALTESINA